MVQVWEGWAEVVIHHDDGRMWRGHSSIVYWYIVIIHTRLLLLFNLVSRFYYHNVYNIYYIAYRNLLACAIMFDSCIDAILGPRVHDRRAVTNHCSSNRM